MRTETPPLIRLEEYRPSDYLIDRVDHYFPAPGGAPPELPEVQVDVKQLPRPGWRDVLIALVAAAAGAAGVLFFA